MSVKTSRRTTENRAQVESTKLYTPLESVRLLKGLKAAKFDETVEVHFRLGVDPRKADQMIRGTLMLPKGTGKEVRVAVFAEGEKDKEARDAGADFVGGEDLAKKVEGGWFDFDVAIATPDMMRVVGRLGRALGPRGLMPNPKAGTVTFDIAKAVQDSKAGKIEFRTDRTGIVHIAIGKASFSEADLLDNYGAVIDELIRAKPAAAKGRYMKSVVMTTSMGPGVPVDPAVTRDFMEERA
ncbi:MAG: 50S ribosomal protein L1 [Actinomycetota bacterium]|jgi:large subunit ribosomal protein L1|nr:50S ribosomal protein L1 [Actinomycetota bacterium]MCL6092819.1 50S ribosomal protein L1 [Actinomycetota bacterium]MDA8166221.1 50S ribosomal protein L1 [Actinomycetota bacterium]